MEANPENTADLGFIDQLMVGAVDQMFFDDWLKNAEPEVLEDIIAKKKKNAEYYYDEYGNINLQRLKEEMTLSDRFGLMVSDYTGEYVSKALGEYMPDLSEHFEVNDFDAAVDNLVSDEGLVYETGNNNLVVSSGSPLEQVGALWQVLKESYLDTGDKKASLSLIVKEARSIVGVGGEGGGKASPAKIKIMGKVCEKLGLKFNRVMPGSKLEPPAENEVQLIIAPSLLPVKTGTQADVDVEALRWYSDIYKEDPGAVWFSASPILAGIYMLNGMSMGDAMTEANIPQASTLLSQQLDSLAKQLDPASTVAEADKAPDGQATG